MCVGVLITLFEAWNKIDRSEVAKKQTKRQTFLLVPNHLLKTQRKHSRVTVDAVVMQTGLSNLSSRIDVL